MKEIAHTRIVAVAQNNLAFKMVFLLPQLFLNVRNLSIKLVLLRLLRSV